MDEHEKVSRESGGGAENVKMNKNRGRHAIRAREGNAVLRRKGKQALWSRMNFRGMPLVHVK
jgi:hypothetical protein